MDDARKTARRLSGADGNDDGDGDDTDGDDARMTMTTPLQRRGRRRTRIDGFLLSINVGRPARGGAQPITHLHLQRATPRNVDTHMFDSVCGVGVMAVMWCLMWFHQLKCAGHTISHARAQSRANKHCKHCLTGSGG